VDIYFLDKWFHVLQPYYYSLKGQRFRTEMIMWFFKQPLKA